MKKTLLAAAALIAMGVAAPSSAGERGGSGKWTPIGLSEVLKAAICAFSGLEDQQHGEEPAGDVVPGVTQTPHQENGVINPPGAASVCQFLNPGKLRRAPEA